MLAAGAATEVLPRQQHAGALITREIQHEIRVQRTPGAVLVGLTDIQVAPLVEQIGAEAAALDRLQELLGNDLVGVDIGAIERRDQAGVLSKSSHVRTP